MWRFAPQTRDEARRTAPNTGVPFWAQRAGMPKFGVVRRGCLIGAGALVTQGTVIPDGMMAFGSPAKVRRPLTEEEIQGNRESAEEYVQEAAKHLE